MDSLELKEILGDRAKDIISNGLNAPLNKKNEMLCPFHADSNPSFSWFEKGKTFKCWACNETMDIYRYYTDIENLTFQEAKQKIADILGIQMVTGTNKKEYTKPTEKHNELSNEIVKYFESRSIPKEILEYWEVESKGKGNNEEIVFKHKDQKGKLVLNAYRNLHTKDFKREIGNKEILFGMDRIDYTKPVLLVEGHIDALSVSTCYKNVVSIPSGINSTEWIENSWNFINKVEKFIFWADNDKKNGIALAEKLRLRIGKEKCIVDYHPNYKDANELLCAEGIEGLSDFIDEMLLPRINGLINMGRRRIQNTEQDTFKCGFNDIDRHLKSLEFNCLSIIFGRDNEGKSTFISQMIAELLKNHKVFLYSGELSENKIENWIMSQIISGEMKYMNEIIDEYGDVETYIKSDAREAICKWYRDKFFIYESSVKKECYYDLFSVMESAFKVYGVRMFFIDNAMMAVDDSNDSTNKAETTFVKKLKQFAMDYGVHVFLIAHPNKEGSNEHQPLNKVDVNGSKNITNIADYVFAIERSWKPTDANKRKNEAINAMYTMEVEGTKDKYYTTIVRLLKNRTKKKRNDFFYRFHTESMRFYNSTVNIKFTGDWKKYLKPEEKEVKYYNGTTQKFSNGELTESDPPF